MAPVTARTAAGSGSAHGAPEPAVDIEVRLTGSCASVSGTVPGREERAGIVRAIASLESITEVREHLRVDGS